MILYLLSSDGSVPEDDYVALGVGPVVALQPAALYIRRWTFADCYFRRRVAYYSNIRL